jgi:hypothetical protein
MRWTEKISAWPVGLVSALVEGPIVGANGRIEIMRFPLPHDTRAYPIGKVFNEAFVTWNTVIEV